MGYKLRREVRDAIPPGALTPAERLLVLEIADQCGDDTREGRPGQRLLAGLTDLSERSIQETLNRIAKKWVELRVPLGHGRDGRLYYSRPDQNTTFRFPPFAPKQGATDPGALGATDPGAYGPEGAMDRGLRRDGSVLKARQIRGQSPQTFPQVSSDSEDDRPESETPTDPHAILAALGCTGARADRVIAYADSLGASGPKGPRWWAKVNAKGDVPKLIAEAERAAVDQDSDQTRRIIEDLTRTGRQCDDHGTPGGAETHPVHGTPLCAACRSGLPPTEPEPDGEAPEIDQIFAAYREGMAAAGRHDIDPVALVEFGTQCRTALANGFTLSILIDTARRAGRTNTSLFAAAAA